MMMLKSTLAQKGAALIVSLMMLVVMTILGISAVTTTTMEEKMAGNIRNKHLSFQATEAAMRVGETRAGALPQTTDFTTSPGTNGLYPQNTQYTIAQLLDTAAGISWQDGSGNDTYLKPPHVAAIPQYIIENHGAVPRDKSCRKDLAPIQICATCCMNRVFRVTARGYGLNTTGQSLLQSTVREN